MNDQKHSDVVELYQFLGIQDVSSVNTTLATGQINGCFSVELTADDYAIDSKTTYVQKT